MEIPIEFYDIRLFLSMITVILIVTNELINPVLGIQNLYIDRKKLRNATYLVVFFFVLVFAASLYQKLVFS